MANNRLEINKGEDQIATFRLRDKANDPLPLATLTKISVEFNRSNRKKLIIDDTQIPSIPATATEQLVNFAADTAGIIGNAIILVFNGIDTLDTVVNAWNAANGANTVTHDGTGTSVLTAVTVKLSNGEDAYFPVSVTDAVLGKVQIILTTADTSALKVGENQTFKVTMDFGEHPGGSRKIARHRNKLDVISDD